MPEKNLEHLYDMVEQLLHMVGNNNALAEELKKGQDELRVDVDELKGGLKGLRSDVDELRRGQDELKQELINISQKAEKMFDDFGEKWIMFLTN